MYIVLSFLSPFISYIAIMFLLFILFTVISYNLYLPIKIVYLQYQCYQYRLIDYHKKICLDYSLSYDKRFPIMMIDIIIEHLNICMMSLSI